MSYQSSQSANTNSNEVISKNLSSFEKWIVQCCKAPEWELRKYLKKVLVRAGFEIFEDGYKSDRCTKDKRYESVHNMFCVRGTPRVCLVSHTDVCRDHAELKHESKYGSFGSDYHYFMYDKRSEEHNKPVVARKVEPVVKLIEDESGKLRRIIQDRDCRLQVGGDDRLGVAIITWIALNSGLDMGLYFPTDEEVGLKSAAACEMPQLKDFDLFVEVDRGNHSNELVNKISGEQLAGYDTTCRLLSIAYDLGMPRTIVNGMGTDVAALKKQSKIKEAVNMTCGYHQSHGAGSEEFIDVQEARDTMKYVAGIVKDYYLNG